MFTGVVAEAVSAFAISSALLWKVCADEKLTGLETRHEDNKDYCSAYIDARKKTFGIELCVILI